jgi:hypothetical protein
MKLFLMALSCLLCVIVLFYIESKGTREGYAARRSMPWWFDGKQPLPNFSVLPPDPLPAYGQILPKHMDLIPQERDRTDRLQVLPLPEKTRDKPVPFKPPSVINFLDVQ